MQNKPNLVRLLPAVCVAGRIQNPLFDKGLRKYKAFGHPKSKPKTNPNEPKRTQSKPNFWPVRGTQTQNEPKQTQFIAAQPCLPRRSLVRSRVGEPECNPIPEKGGVCSMNRRFFNSWKNSLTGGIGVVEYLVFSDRMRVCI